MAPVRSSSEALFAASSDFCFLRAYHSAAVLTGMPTWESRRIDIKAKDIRTKTPKTKKQKTNTQKTKTQKTKAKIQKKDKGKDKRQRPARRWLPTAPKWARDSRETGRTLAVRTTAPAFVRPYCFVRPKTTTKPCASWRRSSWWRR